MVILTIAWLGMLCRELRDALVDKMAGPFPQELRDYQEVRGLPAGQVEPK